MVPWGPSSPVTWLLRNHLARCPKTPGPQGTRICVRVVPRGSTSRATWSLAHHPRRRQRRPGHERTRTRAKLVPRGPSSCGIWSLVLHLARFWRRRVAGVVPRGPDSKPGWFPRDQVYLQSGPRRVSRISAAGLLTDWLGKRATSNSAPRQMHGTVRLTAHSCSRTLVQV
jgi:hypothetical protein